MSKSIKKCKKEKKKGVKEREMKHERSIRLV